MGEIIVAGGLRTKVRLVDMSQAGFRMECLAFIPDERPFFLTMPELAKIECTVAWRSSWQYGCTFASTLDEAIYRQIIEAYPALRTDQA